jgi:hypothetical protein
MAGILPAKTVLSKKTHMFLPFVVVDEGGVIRYSKEGNIGTEKRNLSQTAKIRRKNAYEHDTFESAHSPQGTWMIL